MYHEDYWTAREVEDGMAPHDAVYVPSQGVWRQPLDEDGDDDEGASYSTRKPSVARPCPCGRMWEDDCVGECPPR